MLAHPSAPPSGLSYRASTLTSEPPAVSVVTVLTVEKQLATVAAALPPKKRARLAELILKTLEGEDAEKIAQLWHEEADSRAKAYAKGKIVAHSVEHALGIHLAT